MPDINPNKAQCVFCHESPTSWAFRVQPYMLGMLDEKTGQDVVEPLQFGPLIDACPACCELILKKDEPALAKRAVMAFLSAHQFKTDKATKICATMVASMVKGFFVYLRPDEITAPKGRPN